MRAVCVCTSVVLSSAGCWIDVAFIVTGQDLVRQRVALARIVQRDRANVILRSIPGGYRRASFRMASKV